MAEETMMPQTTAEPRAMIGDIPVFCAFDELVPIGKVIGNPKNPNKHPKEQIKLLATIIRGQGWRAPITVSRRSGYIVRGHGRLEAAQLLGLEKVPVDYQNYATEAEEWADLIADNRLAELAELDNSMLADMLQELDTGEIPLVYTGYTEEDLASILMGLTGADDTINQQEDDVPEAPEEPISRPGDLWLLGRHRLICGSATDKATIERLMDGQKAQCVFTDPPYGVSYVSASGKFDMIINDDLTGDKLIKNLLLPAFRNYVEHTVDDAAFYIWHASISRKEFDTAIAAAGLVEQQYLIWVKNGIALGRADYQWAHEPCYYCSKAGHTQRYFGDRAQSTVWRAILKTSGQIQTIIGPGVVLTDGQGGTAFIAEKPPKGKKLRYIRVKSGEVVELYSDRKQDTVWEVSRETGTEHPTQKPVELVTRALENSTKPGELVIDFFGGSGSTLIGAELTGRRCFMTELDPKYIDVIVGRFAKAAKTQSIRCVRDGKEIAYSELLNGR